MFKKVLLAEDIDTISKGVMSIMEALQIDNVHQAQYCDDAYIQIKKATLNNQDFDLLITDLSFKDDHRKQKLSSGDELIKKVKQDFPGLKIIVYSVEDRTERIRQLMKDLKINGYVAKGRKGLRELEEAIVTVHQGGNYLSAELSHTLNKKPPIEIIDTDIELLRLLSQGYSQDQISRIFKTENIKPSSLSSLEKRLNVLKEHFGAKNAIHLVSIGKDLGLI